MDEAARAGNRLAASLVWLRAVRDLFLIAPKEHWHVFIQDLRYTLRGWAASPAFALVAIASLAPGLGANIAIFSLWNDVIRAALPVRAPRELVIPTRPLLRRKCV